MFTLELLQKINDWQCGGNAIQNKKRSAALKEISKHLPLEFRQTDKSCYRQIALDKETVWTVGTQHQLSEKISSWTESLTVAKTFKGGVPPPSYQGIIFSIEPTITSVILNLNSLYSNTQFIEAINNYKREIIGYSKGIGKYGNSQQEVVIEIEYLPLNSIHSWGGYVESEVRLASVAEMIYKRKPSAEELAQVKDLIVQSGHELGPSWLSTPVAVQRVSEKLIFHAARLSKS